MRLPDLVNPVRRKASEVFNFVKHPTQVLKQRGKKTALNIYHSLTLPGKEKSDSQETSESQQPQPLETIPQPTSLQRVVIPGHSPKESRAAEELLVVSRHQHGNYDVQPLPANHQISASQWDQYTVKSCLVNAEDTRIYSGINRNNDDVFIKEYILNESDFSAKEIQERKQSFERLVNLNLKIGHGPDFRIIKLLDVITHPENNRCHLVYRSLGDRIVTLEDYLTHSPKMSASEVREILRQVLESLRFLHSAYRVWFSADVSERGIPHGNISLKSLLFRQFRVAGVTQERRFFIYLSDLALWNHIFYTPGDTRYQAIATCSQELGSFQQDLIDLGTVAFQLAGGQLNTVNNLPQELISNQPWLDLADEPLRLFLRRLVGAGGRFNTAEEALKELLHLPEPQPIVLPEEQEESDVREAKTQQVSFLWFIVAGAIATLLLIELGRSIIRERPQLEVLPQIHEPISYFSDVNTLGGREVRYMIESESHWDVILQRRLRGTGFSLDHLPNLLEAIEERYNQDTSHSPVTLSQTQILAQPLSGITLFDRNTTQEEPVSNQEFILQYPRLWDVAFMRERADFPANFQSVPVARDALVVLVPFSDVNHPNGNAPRRLEGHISLDDLRTIYTGDSLDPVLSHGQAVTLYFPDPTLPGNQDTIRLFETLVLGDDDALVSRFHSLREAAVQRDQAIANTPEYKDNNFQNNLYSRLNFTLRDQSRTSPIAIGFDRLGRAFNQCSVYPLAIRDSNGQHQPLLQATGQPIDEFTDLCGRKGSYFPDLSNYPNQLQYQLSVVFSRESEIGSAMAELLKTTEGQYLMSELGLIPIDHSMAEILTLARRTRND